VAFLYSVLAKCYINLFIFSQLLLDGGQRERGIAKLVDKFLDSFFFFFVNGPKIHIHIINMSGKARRKETTRKTKT
jgi:hypothetical protein